MRIAKWGERPVWMVIEALQKKIDKHEAKGLSLIRRGYMGQASCEQDTADCWRAIMLDVIRTAKRLRK